MERFARNVRRVAEGVAAALMASMFLLFLLQIFSRYVLGGAFGWTLELCLALWIWIVFLGGAFILRERDHISFDILYLSAGPGPRKVMAILAALIIAGMLLWSLPPTWDWIDFMRIKRSASLRVPMRDIYAVYAVFLVAVPVAYLWKVFRVLRRPPEEWDPAVDGYKGSGEPKK